MKSIISSFKNIFILVVVSVIAFSLGFTLQNQDPKENALQRLEQLGLLEQNFTSPSWTQYLRARTAMQNAIKNLVSAEMPYNVNMSINGDPSTRMGFAWFTNPGVTGGKLQIVEGEQTDYSAFANPMYTINATTAAVNNINYNVSRNYLLELAGIPDNTKRSYRSNKALATNLRPNTTYSFRVGKDGSWSGIGTFTTAKSGKDDFSFIYITDTQARTDEMFDISRKTVQAARKMLPQAGFLICTGDLVETNATNNSEWEWEQWFETMQDVWYTTPIAPVQGNHDSSPNRNMFYHFNTDTAFNVNRSPDAQLAMNGTVYSFVYGDALFLVVNYEDYRKGEPYFQALEDWMARQIEANKDVKWKIATQHKTIYTGAAHQDGADGRIIRERMAPVYDRLNIDLVLQGHDHIYEVIGPVYNHEWVRGSVSNVEEEKPRTQRENMTGKRGGVFNVQKGTLYFINNSAGRKKYEPRTQTEMTNAFERHGVNNYFSMFTGKFGQDGDPTFSNIEVSTNQIKITTYSVNFNGETTEFDSFVIVK